ncbi:RNA-binding cell elongation regulator Jag/EloR [Macrococcus equi]|uniref:RNA-binding cell elongation regulator Jag/EloR n=1 Tax=Macrococcus equi TaxID=3395462 RepID=UPI0039BE360C
MLEKKYCASTVDEAIHQGLVDLNLEEKQVKIEVLSAGKKGFFGFGQSDAIVKLIVIDPELKKLPSIEAIQSRMTDLKEEVGVQKKIQQEIIETHLHIEPVEDKELTKHQSKEKALNDTERYLSEIIQAMGLQVDVHGTIKNSSEVFIELDSKDASRIIGKRGQLLNSLQLLAQNYYNHIEKGYTTVTLDIENYRAKRTETLQNLALNMSKKAIATKTPVKFEPMPNYERKIMHQILTNIENIETYSEGREPHRYLVIKAR